MSAPYALKLAAQSLFREKWINLLSVLTIGSGLLVISVAFLAAYNIKAATGRLPEKFSMVLYLDEGTTKAQIDRTMLSLKRDPAVSSVSYISKGQAMKELKATIRNADALFEGLDENPLPASLEVKLKKDSVGPGTVKELAAKAGRLKGVREVDYGEKFLSSLYSLRRGVNSLGLILIAIIATGIIFVCYSTVKILFYRRSEEIETFKLLGATSWFIRFPFLLEGTVIGFSGGLLSLIGILSFYYFGILKLSLTSPVFRAVLFPADLFLPLPLVGLLLGLTGSAIALGRLRY
ncbi:MAG: permease-like cell division protein FtsX [Candidatus Sulfobium sp.]